MKTVENMARALAAASQASEATSEILEGLRTSGGGNADLSHVIEVLADAARLCLEAQADTSERDTQLLDACTRYIEEAPA